MSFTGKIVACTGHRPEKVGGYSEEAFLRLAALATHCLTRLEPKLVIVGGALGWDQACAYACAGTKIPFKVYYPFEGYDSQWPRTSQFKAREIHDHAIEHRMVCESGYAPWKMSARNETMVDDAEIVLALYSGNAGGTANCVKYARSQNKPVLNCWERFVKKEF